MKELLYVPRTIYRILTKTISPIKGHDSSDEEIVGMMKNMLFNKDKVFDHEHIPHVDMESLPCFTPVLSVLHDAGLLNFCSDIVDWNEELILQFYAMLHITGEADDINSWVLDWMTENTHYKAPASELLRALPLSPPPEGARCLYDEP